MNNRVRRKTRSSARVGGIGEHRRALKLLFSSLSQLLRLSLTLSIPIVCYLLLGSIDFLTFLSLGEGKNLFQMAGQLLIENESERYASELVKLDFYIYLYAFISVLLLFNMKIVWQHAFHHKHFVVIFVVLLLGVFVSTESAKVLTNVVHLAFGAFSALLFSIGLLGKTKPLRKTCLVVLLPMLFVLVASLLLLLLHFQSAEVIELLTAGRRYAGIAGNPNTLGGICVLGLWAAMSLVYLSNSKIPVLPLTIVGLFIFGLALTGSATSTIVSLAMIAVLLWGLILKWCSGITRVVLNSLVVLISVFLALFLVVSVGDNYLELATESVGRETTFSGRIELWAVAREAIAQKPLFGWSYDSHLSVYSYQQYFVPYNHYHNGYLDTLVAGGFALGGLMLFHFAQFFLTYLRILRINQRTLPLLLPMVIILITNFAEYSLLRNNSPIWTVYMLTYFVVVTLFAERVEAVSNSRQSRRRRVSRSKKKRITS